MKKRMTLLALALAVPLAITAAACEEKEDPCVLHCQILEDCGAVDSSNDCLGTCDAMLAGECTGDCEAFEAGGDPARCAEKLLDANSFANGDECSPDFQNSWCDTYYDDPDCAPFEIFGITCS